ncbi:sporulation histidine kinase inhibitor Sda [Halalkalibacterium halodurans]|nr:sporulation histidine kinase inhibitor Sda [Halalkalibacterium halodurans]
MDNIHDDVLIEAYVRAKELNLKQDFIELLMNEMVRRCLPFQEEKIVRI